MILYSGENIKLKVFEKLSENNLIRCYWEKLTRSVGNEDLKKKLKVRIVTKWIDIRVNAFIKTWVQIIRRKESRSGTSNDGRQEVARGDSFNQQSCIGKSTTFNKKVVGKNVILATFIDLLMFI